jgi:hypothetical protein
MKKKVNKKHFHPLITHICIVAINRMQLFLVNIENKFCVAMCPNF